MTDKPFPKSAAEINVLVPANGMISIKEQQPNRWAALDREIAETKAQTETELDLVSRNIHLVIADMGVLGRQVAAFENEADALSFVETRQAKADNYGITQTVLSLRLWPHSTLHTRLAEVSR